MTSGIEYAFILMIIFHVKHFVADFPLQREYMLQKGQAGWGFVLPLAVHCLVHAALTLLIVLLVNPWFWWLSIVDFATHFLMDRIKSSPRYLGRFNDKTRPGFWNALGFDQMIHHMTHIGIIWVLLASRFSV